MKCQQQLWTDRSSNRSLLLQTTLLPDNSPVKQINTKVNSLGRPVELASAHKVVRVKSIKRADERCNRAVPQKLNGYAQMPRPLSKASTEVVCSVS